MGGVRRGKKAKQKVAEMAHECRKRKLEGRKRNNDEESSSTRGADDPTHASTSKAHPTPPPPATPHPTPAPTPHICTSAEKRKLGVYNTLQPSKKEIVDDENFI